MTDEQKLRYIKAKAQDLEFQLRDTSGPGNGLKRKALKDGIVLWVVEFLAHGNAVFSTDELFTEVALENT